MPIAHSSEEATTKGLGKRPSCAVARNGHLALPTLRYQTRYRFELVLPRGSIAGLVVGEKDDSTIPNVPNTKPVQPSACPVVSLLNYRTSFMHVVSWPPSRARKALPWGAGFTVESNLRPERAVYSRMCWKRGEIDSP